MRPFAYWTLPATLNIDCDDKELLKHAGANLIFTCSIYYYCYCIILLYVLFLTLPVNGLILSVHICVDNIFGGKEERCDMYLGDLQLRIDAINNPCNWCMRYLLMLFSPFWSVKYNLVERNVKRHKARGNILLFSCTPYKWFGQGNSFD